MMSPGYIPYQDLNQALLLMLMMLILCVCFFSFTVSIVISSSHWTAAFRPILTVQLTVAGQHMWSQQTDNWFGCFYDSRNGAHHDSSVDHKEARCRGILTLYCCKAAPAATGHTLTQLLEHSLGKPALTGSSRSVSHVTGSGYTLPTPAWPDTETQCITLENDGGREIFLK